MLIAIFEYVWSSLLMVKYVVWDEGITPLWVKRNVINLEHLNSSKAPDISQVLDKPK